ncbi:MAG: PilZ domain-containing protein [Pseudomonadota bacterium]
MSFPNPFKRMFAEPKTDRRQMERFYSELPATLYAESSDPVECTLLDYSDLGARLKMPDKRHFPDMFKLYVPETDMTYVAEVRRRNGDEAGLFFISGEPGMKPWQGRR